MLLFGSFLRSSHERNSETVSPTDNYFSPRKSLESLAHGNRWFRGCHSRADSDGADVIRRSRWLRRGRSCVRCSTSWVRPRTRITLVGQHDLCGRSICSLVVWNLQFLCKPESWRRDWIRASGHQWITAGGLGESRDSSCWCLVRHRRVILRTCRRYWVPVTRVRLRWVYT